MIAFSVAHRTREIGIRMALGAQRFEPLWLILNQVALLVLAGLALGAAISLGGVRLLGSLLYGIQMAPIRSLFSVRPSSCSPLPPSPPIRQRAARPASTRRWLCATSEPFVSNFVIQLA